MVHLGLSTSQECYDAIATLAVRGAPAIGIFAGYAFYVLARQAPYDGFGMFRAAMNEVRDYLASSRPTAVNLKWALDRMMGVVDAHADASRDGMLAVLRAEACAIQTEDVQMCRRMSELGLGLCTRGAASSRIAMRVLWPPAVMGRRSVLFCWETNAACTSRYSPTKRVRFCKERG